MADKFLLIAITCADCVCDEGEKISVLLENGFDYVHIRHPHAERKQIEQILEAIPESLRHRIKLHDMHDLAEIYHTGIQINHRGGTGINCIHKSKGCHSVKEIESISGSDYDYVMLSPVFPSISKPGYQSAENLTEAFRIYKGNIPVVALGGVTPDKLKFLQQIGFAGGAMLGAINWHTSLKNLSENPYTL